MRDQKVLDTLKNVRENVSPGTLLKYDRLCRRVYWQKGGNLRGLLSGCYKRWGRLAFLDRCRSLRYRVIHRRKAWHLECVSYYPNHDLVPPSRLEGCPQMHQATDSGFPPK